MPSRKSATEEPPRLSDLCTDCFVLTLQLRTVNEYGDPAVLRRRIKDLLDRLERDARRAGIETEEVLNAKFALVAFIDESIIGSQWNEKSDWLAQPLQLELFNRFDAGEEFFVRLRQFSDRPQANLGVLEVYYMCMVLGFKGKYALQDTDRLRLLIDDTYKDLRRGGETARTEQALSPNGKRGDEFVDVMTKEVPLWVIVVAALAVGFFFYLVMTFLISGSASDAERTVNQIVQDWMNISAQEYV